MSEVEIVCPKCGHFETAVIGPTISISASLDVTVKEVSCSECGYEGTAGDSE